MGGHASVGHAWDMHKRASRRSPARRVALSTVVLALIATPLASAAEAGITQPFEPKTSVTLAPGVDFEVGTMKTTGGRPQSVRVGTVAPRQDGVQLKALLSNDKVVQREVVTRIVKAKARVGFKPMLATNGDMSMRNRVDALGVFPERNVTLVNVQAVLFRQHLGDGALTRTGRTSHPENVRQLTCNFHLNLQPSRSLPTQTTL